MPSQQHANGHLAKFELQVTGQAGRQDPLASCLLKHYALFCYIILSLALAERNYVKKSVKNQADPVTGAGWLASLNGSSHPTMCRL